MVLYSSCPKGTERKAPTMTRFENPYFVRAIIVFPADTCFDYDDEKTIVKAFETKREAWDFVQEIIGKYDRDYNDYTLIESIKVQKNWETLWEY